MESVILVAPRGYSVDFKAKVPSGYRVSEGGNGRTVIDDGTTRIYIGRSDSVRDELGPEELHRITSLIADPVFYTFDFTDIRFCKAILPSIADDPKLLVDNDHGVLLPGPEFIQLLYSKPGWDWRWDVN